MYIASQIIGIIIILTSLFAMQLKDKTKFLFWEVFNSILSIFSLVLVGGVLGGASLFVGSIRKFWFYKNSKQGKKNSIYSLIVFSIASILVTIFMWEGYLSLLTLLGLLAVTYGLWQDNIYVLRYCAIVGLVGFGVYSFVAGAYTLALNNLLLLISTIISIIRFKAKNINSRNKQ